MRPNLEYRLKASSGQDRSGNHKNSARTTDKSNQNGWIYSLLSRNNSEKRELTQGNGAMDVLTDSARKTVELMCQMGIFKNGIGLNSDKTKLLSAWMTSTASSFCLNTGTAANSNQFQFPVIIPTSSLFLSNYGTTAPTTSSQLSVYSVRKAVTVLRGYNAQPFADGYYVGYAHPNALHSLRKDPTWVQWNIYQNSQETMYKGEAGKVERVRFIDSTLAPRYAVNSCRHEMEISCNNLNYGQKPEMVETVALAA